MNPLHHANAHETAHLPPPTAEDYERLDKALNHIFQSKDTKEMTEQIAQTEEATVTIEQLEQIGEQTAFAADELLKQAGWDILAEMLKALLMGINSTRVIVEPVVNGLPLLKEKVSDPEGLSKIVETLRHDIAIVAEGVLKLASRHQGKTGAPTLEELVAVGIISEGYSAAQTKLERGIQPLILQLCTILEEAGVTEFEVKA